MKRDGLVKWLSELNKDSIPIAGGKGANLAEMYNLKMPVPSAFVVSAQAWDFFLETTGLSEKINLILTNLDVDNTAILNQASRDVRRLIESQEFPSILNEEILESYEHLSVDKDSLRVASAEAIAILRNAYEPVFVAVRSSATTEDLAEASFAGQQETFLNVKGNVALLSSIKKCFSSLYTPRAIYYRTKKGFDQTKAKITVVVQLMVNAERSGVMFSKDPINLSDNVVIEAVYGLGEGIVSGQINPDHYVIDRELNIIEKKIGKKEMAILRDSSGKNITIKIVGEKREAQVLMDHEIKRLADYAIKLESHYNKPQDTEFALDKRDIYIVQTRPITTLETRKEKQDITGNMLLSGLAASPGIASGVVRIINNLEELEKVKKGDVLVTKMTNPDMVVSMQKAAAIVTDEGGVTSHAAIVSREMGIPCVVGTKLATQTLKDGMKITVNGFAGKVYEGETKSVEVEIKPIVNTKTRIKVVVDLPDYAERAAKTMAEAVGLVRLEGMIAESGKHPYGYLRTGKISDYSNMIFLGVSKIAEHFREVWVRTSDIRSDEYKNLEGAPQKDENNPMLGMHGIRFSLKNREIFKAELLALKKIADTGKTKIGVLLPQIISFEEVRKTKELLKEINAENLTLGVMIETPAACMIIEELCKEGIGFISFGTNDLTQYTLAIDRNNEDVQYLYNEMHLSVLREMLHVIRVCKKYGVETSICGQAGSRKDMVEFLVKNGIDGITANVDSAEEISRFVAGLEGISVSKDVSSVMMNKKSIEQKPEEKAVEENNEKKFGVTGTKAMSVEEIYGERRENQEEEEEEPSAEESETDDEKETEEVEEEEKKEIQEETENEPENKEVELPPSPEMSEDAGQVMDGSEEQIEGREEESVVEDVSEESEEPKEDIEEEKKEEEMYEKTFLF